MQKSTQELLHRLKETDDIQIYLDENNGEIIKETIQGYINGLLEIKRLKLSDVAARSGQGDYVYKVFGGKRKASRDILLAVSVGMGLTLAETQLLLRIAQTAQLDPRNRRDSVIIYALHNNMAVVKANEILYDIGEVSL